MILKQQRITPGKANASCKFRTATDLPRGRCSSEASWHVCVLHRATGQWSINSNCWHCPKWQISLFSAKVQRSKNFSFFLAWSPGRNGIDPRLAETDVPSMYCCLCSAELPFPLTASKVVSAHSSLSRSHSPSNLAPVTGFEVYLPPPVYLAPSVNFYRYWRDHFESWDTSLCLPF